MHITVTLPNPLARLTRILVALEHGRVAVEPHDHGARVDACREETRANANDDLMNLSLCHPESPHELPWDDLEFLSLSRIEPSPPGRRDMLSDLSLERDFPPRPGS